MRACLGWLDRLSKKGKSAKQAVLEEQASLFGKKVQKKESRKGWRQW